MSNKVAGAREDGKEAKPKPGDIVMIEDWNGRKFLLKVEERLEGTRTGGLAFGDRITGREYEETNHGKDVLGVVRTMPVSRIVPRKSDRV